MDMLLETRPSFILASIFPSPLFARAIPILLYLSVYNLVFVTCTMSIESRAIMYRIFCRPSRADVADVAQAAKTLTLEAKR